MPQRVATLDGTLLVTDFGYQPCRVVKRIGADGKFLGTMGGAGTDAEFARPMGIAVAADSDGRDCIWVADTGHRLFVLRDGAPTRVFGAEGDDVGSLRFPTGVAAHPDGGVVVCEAGNHRIQWFGPDGVSRGVFGRAGGAPGEFRGPYDCAIDGDRLWVADTDNHRVQGLSLDTVPWRLTKEDRP
jgi:DNA-binding beta-propeller fold protein YncE